MQQENKEEYVSHDVKYYQPAGKGKWKEFKPGSNCLQKPHNIHRNRLKTLAFYY